MGDFVEKILHSDEKNNLNEMGTNDSLPQIVYLIVRLLSFSYSITISKKVKN